jgi:hypothetical protein
MHGVNVCTDGPSEDENMSPPAPFTPTRLRRKPAALRG